MLPSLKSRIDFDINILHLQHKRCALLVMRGSVLKAAAVIAADSRREGMESSHVPRRGQLGENGIDPDPAPLYLAHYELEHQ